MLRSIDADTANRGFRGVHKWVFSPFGHERHEARLMRGELQVAPDD